MPAAAPEAAPAVPAWIEALPKAELHLHLEGSPTPATLVALAERHGRRLTTADAREQFRYRDFLGFLLALKWVSDQLETPDDYAFILRGLLARLHRQNVLYAEITFAVGVALWRRQEPDAILAALRGAVEDSKLTNPVEVRWVIDAVRQFGAEHVAHVAEYAVRWREAGEPSVVAFGIGGDEAGGPPELFRGTFEKVRAAGLRVTVHAGETTGPESIWGALRALGAERIGHGLACFRDVELMEHLKRERIPLECCPTSNLRTGALRTHTGGDDLAKHPVVEYVRHGVPLTLNTDDPGIFDCTLNSEYALAHRLGLTRDEVIGVARNAFTFAFCEQETRQRLVARFDAGVALLPS